MYITSSFSYYLINFYFKYLPGSVYTNAVVNSLSEAAAQTFSIILLKFMSVKKGFAFSFILCGISCMVVVFAEATGSDRLIPIAILGAKIGVSSAFCYLYFSMVEFFDSGNLGLVLGLCNVVSRLFTIAAPMVAEFEDPAPMISCAILCIFALTACLLLKKPVIVNPMKYEQN